MTMINPSNSNPTFINQLIDSLCRQFLQQVSPTEIQLPPIPSTILQSDDFQFRLYNEIFNLKLPANNSAGHLPPPRYAYRVLKRIITLIEDDAFDQGYNYPEINDHLIDYYAALLLAPSSSSENGLITQQRTPVTYTITPNILETPSSSHLITLHENRNIISGHGTTGARTWEAALALGEFFIYHHHRSNDRDFKRWCPRDKKFLELGSGTGFLSILLANLGAKEIISTDGDPTICEILRKSVKENNADNVVRVRRLLWGDADKECEPKCQKHEKEKEYSAYENIDLIIAADVTYDTSILPHLTQTIEHILSNPKNAPNCAALMSATIRNQETFSAFLRECQRLKLKVQELQKWIPPEPRILYYPTGTEIKFLDIRRWDSAD